MGQPTASDPLGQKPDPKSVFDALEGVIDQRIDDRLRGRAFEKFTGVPDMHLVQELLARGWAVFRPRIQEGS